MEAAQEILGTSWTHLLQSHSPILQWEGAALMLGLKMVLAAMRAGSTIVRTGHGEPVCC